jgi:dTDP-4-dehydrorhamnose 3,5-epimerase
VISEELSIPGVLLMEGEQVVDERGSFARFFSADELAAHQQAFTPTQASTSFNAFRGTLRGLHLQLPPSVEAKVIRCIRGAIFDVSVDLRPESRAFGSWVGVELSRDRIQSLYLPSGTAHGFVTLEPESEVEYLIDTAYAPELAAGLRWDDPAIGIEWPIAPTVISERDRSFPPVDLSHLRTHGLVALAVTEEGRP